MDISPASMNYCTQYQWMCQSSDSEFYSISSPETVSPDAFVDFNFSPSCQSYGSATDVRSTCSGGGKASTLPSLCKGGALPGERRRKTRSKNPSKQRQSASEKEKLRMRDLTKALNHLRTYLPPSVAPAGQSLTKIETLRLTIRYISHLSAQLGLSDETRSQGREVDSSSWQGSPDIQDCCQHSSTPGHWEQEQGQRPQAEGSQGLFTPVWPAQDTEWDNSLFSAALGMPVQDDLFNSSMDSLLQSPQYAESAASYQVYNEGLSCQTVPQEFWV